MLSFVFKKKKSFLCTIAVHFTHFIFLFMRDMGELKTM